MPATLSRNRLLLLNSLVGGIPLLLLPAAMAVLRRDDRLVLRDSQLTTMMVHMTTAMTISLLLAVMLGKGI